MHRMSEWKLKTTPGSSWVPSLCSNHWVLLPFSSSSHHNLSPSQSSFAQGCLTFCVDSGHLQGCSALHLWYTARVTTSFLFPFFGDQFQSSPHSRTCLASVFGVALCRPSLLPSPPLQSAALFICYLQSPTMPLRPCLSFKSRLESFHHAASAWKDAYIFFLLLALDLWPLSGLLAWPLTAPAFPNIRFIAIPKVL